MFKQVVGNEKLKGYLEHILVSGHVAHSLLFAGPEGIGKSLFARNFAHRLLSTEDPTGSHRQKLERGVHPDFHFYRPEGKTGMHSIGSMRLLGEEVYLPPHEASCKVFVIEDADRMLPYSANALLKTFEEPPPATIILLLSSAPELLLPTILSRCTSFYFQPLTEEELVRCLNEHYHVDLEAAQHVAALAQGSVGKAMRFLAESKDSLRHQALQLFSAGKFSSYKELAASAKKLAEQVDVKLKETEEGAKEELMKAYCDKLTASQRDAVEKELEGMVAVQMMREAEGIFDLLLTWMRDLHLLKQGGKEKWVFHRDQLPALQGILARANDLPSLEDVLEAVKTAKLSLARSTGLALCLENVFLRFFL